jgi:hypothetical protein
VLLGVLVSDSGLGTQTWKLETLRFHEPWNPRWVITKQKKIECMPEHPTEFGKAHKLFVKYVRVPWKRNSKEGEFEHSCLVPSSRYLFSIPSQEFTQISLV